MAIVDTSAWVEFIRGDNEEVRASLRELVRMRSVATTEPITMELLAGARDAAHERRLRNMLAWATPVRVEGLADWESAAIVYRTCRASGVTVSSQLDCLIAAVAIREEVPVLHAERDFDLIAQHTPLRVVAL